MKNNISDLKKNMYADLYHFHSTYIINSAWWDLEKERPMVLFRRSATIKILPIQVYYLY